MLKRNHDAYHNKHRALTAMKQLVHHNRIRHLPTLEERATALAALNVKVQQQQRALGVLYAKKHKDIVNSFQAWMARNRAVLAGAVPLLPSTVNTVAASAGPRPPTYEEATAGTTRPRSALGKSAVDAPSATSQAHSHLFDRLHDALIPALGALESQVAQAPDPLPEGLLDAFFRLTPLIQTLHDQGALASGALSRRLHDAVARVFLVLQALQTRLRQHAGTLAARQRKLESGARLINRRALLAATRNQVRVARLRGRHQQAERLRRFVQALETTRVVRVSFALDDLAAPVQFSKGTLLT
ncbi:hypothetical protein LTR36_001704 [Oleoguttula mirabilis]|uniref:Uncharacterized protein n=1 Tax=Oleoguttula mirabilis TaxID=1507867 RepID=A0AAV9J3G7_9PEZI|nr:hypothetical protein LTR36_001704 [Oleoguttula mirabilis]